jgi:hypothetical protein
MKKYGLFIIMLLTIFILLINLFHMNSEFLGSVNNISSKFRHDSVTISELSGRIKMMYKNCHFEIQSETYLKNENGNIIRVCL